MKIDTLHSISKNNRFRQCFLNGFSRNNAQIVTIICRDAALRGNKRKKMRQTVANECKR